MPRSSRKVAVGYPHHITQRGNNREPVFFDDEDRWAWMSCMGTLPEVFLSCLIVPTGC